MVGWLSFLYCMHCIEFYMIYRECAIVYIDIWHKQLRSMQSSRQQQLNTERVANNQFFEYPYRWVIVALMGMMFVINGLVNNTVIPIAAKITEVYDMSDVHVNAPIIVSFLVYSVMNFPANHIIDTKGLRISFLIGASFFMGGAALYTLINKSYIFVILGYTVMSIGQPFIINCPAKIATYWFFDNNRPFATALMTGLMLVGTGFGFILPTLVVKQRASVTDSKSEIFYLYAGQFLASAIALILIFMFMRKQPPTPPSLGAEQQKSDLRQSLKILRKDRNLWVFFSGYIILYGTLLSFSSTVNLQLKPYGYTNFQIGLFALILIIMGVGGAIIWSLYLKKTTNYRFTIRTIPTISVFVMIGICIALNAGAHMVIVFILGGLVGFSVTPIMPISYDLGCELSFPIGEAQVTGLLNGGAQILAFILTLIISAAVKFKTQGQSMAVMIIYIVLVAIGTVFYYFVKIDLKRRRAQQQGHTVDVAKMVQQANNKTEGEGSNQAKDETTTNEDNNKGMELIDTKYMKFNQEQEVYI